MKFVLSSVICCVAAMVLLASVSSEAGEAKKKKAVAGKVVKVDAENLTIKTADKKKDNVVTAGKEISFKLNAQTKVEKAGAKKDDPATPAAVADIQVGLAVAVVGAEGGAAEKVIISAKKKKDN